MKKKVIYCIIIIILFIMVNLFPPTLGVSTSKKIEEDPYKDFDGDGIPDYLDNEEIPKVFQSSQSQRESESSPSSSMGPIEHQNWSLDYAEDEEYGAYIQRVNWNGSFYIYRASVPWVKIDNVTYEIPNDFMLVTFGHYSYISFFMVFFDYSITIEGENYRMEIVWYIWKAKMNNMGKITMHTILGVNQSRSHSLFVPYRIDFDIMGPDDDRFYGYGSEGWGMQNYETYQFTYAPTDPITGCKLKQSDYIYPSCWGGVKAWNNGSKNYLLRGHMDEYKGDPNSYINGENTYRQDDLVWTTAYTSGISPIWCGPEIYLH